MSEKQWPKCSQVREAVNRPFNVFRKCMLDENETGYGTGDYEPFEKSVVQAIRDIRDLSTDQHHPVETSSDKQLQALIAQCYNRINNLLDLQKPNEAISDDIYEALSTLDGILNFAYLVGHSPIEGAVLFYNTIANETMWED